MSANSERSQQQRLPSAVGRAAGATLVKIQQTCGGGPALVCLCEGVSSVFFHGCGAGSASVAGPAAVSAVPGLCTASACGALYVGPAVMNG